MALPPVLRERLRLPVIASPMFIVSGPELVIAQCKAGIVGSMPALSARPAAQLDEWLHQIREELAAWDRDHPERPAAPYAINHICHRSNDRLEQDLEITSRHRVPIIITSLGARREIYDAIHASGAVILHDVINSGHGRSAIDKGADGLIAVAAGAGGHAGALSPFALVQELRAWFDGPLVLSGAIANGHSILAAQAMGADLAYVGSAFIATKEARAPDGYKEMIVESSAEDIVYSNLFTGVHGNYLKPSIAAAGLDPEHLPESDPSKMDFGSAGGMKIKAWKDIWGCGQGIGAIHEIVTAEERVDRLVAEYHQARRELAAKASQFGGDLQLPA
jgi:nitronate monooxygenase